MEKKIMWMKNTDRFSLRYTLSYLFACSAWLKFEEWDKINRSGNKINSNSAKKL